MSSSILIADDDPVVRRGLRCVFAQAGYSVVEASDGQEALDMALSGAAKIMLLDIEMPTLNGFEVCYKLRHLEVNGRLPVIMLTGCDEIEDIRHGLVNGADLYLTKPISTKEILRNVRSILLTN